MITDKNIRHLVDDWCSGDEHKKNEIINNYGHISDWDVSNVTNMDSLFAYKQNFNDNISKWNVSKVTNMYCMFLDATLFNQPLNTWDVSNVIIMQCMFADATSFNQPLNNWNVSKVEYMDGMFWYATNFNQPLNNWNVSNVKNMDDMFNDNITFKEYNLQFEKNITLRKFKRWIYKNRLLHNEIKEQLEKCNYQQDENGLYLCPILFEPLNIKKTIKMCDGKYYQLDTIAKLKVSPYTRNLFTKEELLMLKYYNEHFM